jgi:hypothetical protein
MTSPPTPTSVFPSILCGADNSACGIAARHQARWLAGPEGAVEVVPARGLTGLELAPLRRRCEPHDLLVLPSLAETHALATGAGVPVLLANWCPDGKDVTDDILVAVEDPATAARAARLAAQMAACHRGTVSIVAAPTRSRELERAIAASRRIIVSTVGTPPRLLGDLDTPQRVVAKAVAAAGATLLVLGAGDPALVAELARFAGCSVLAVPAPVPAAARFVPFGGRRATVRGPVRVPVGA